MMNAEKLGEEMFLDMIVNDSIMKNKKKSYHFRIVNIFVLLFDSIMLKKHYYSF